MKEGKNLISCRSNWMRSMFATSHHLEGFAQVGSTSTPSEVMYFWYKGKRPAHFYDSTHFWRQKIFESATRECRMSPTITTLTPLSRWFFLEWNTHRAGPVGVVSPIAGVDYFAFTFLRERTGARAGMPHDHHVHFHWQDIIDGISPVFRPFWRKS